MLKNNFVGIDALKNLNVFINNNYTSLSGDKMYTNVYVRCDSISYFNAIEIKFMVFTYAKTDKQRILDIYKIYNLIRTNKFISLDMNISEESNAKFIEAQITILI